MAKVALLIGVSEYEPGLNSLPAAVKDVAEMQRVLEHSEIGCFDEVRTLLNPERQAMEEAIETLFSGRTREDLVLLFFSGHGIKDDNGRLYFATRRTRKNPKGELVKATAVQARFVHDIMTNSRSKRQVVIIDCCFSGAFAEGLLAKDDGSVDIKTQLGGEGRAVLTSSTCTQYSFEQQGAELSIYTRHLVEGIKTGAADQDGNGQISINDLHEYAKDKVQKAAPAMKPEIYAVKEGFKILLAKAPVGDPKLKYRKEAEKRACRGEFSLVGRKILDLLRGELQLSPEEANAIEAEVLQPYREYEKKLQEYEQIFVEMIDHEYPLSSYTRSELKDLQRLLSLREEDVAPIEKRIISGRESSSIHQALGAGLETKSVGESSPTTKFVPTESLTDEVSSGRRVDYTRLQHLLQAENWQEADQETKSIMLELCGRKQEERLETNDLRNFSCQDLRTIDQLWVEHSNGRFGFSVQQRIWQSIGGKKGADKETWWCFGEHVGWRAGDDWVPYKNLSFTLDASEGHFPYCRAWIEWGWPKHVVGRFDALASRFIFCNRQ